MNTLTKNRIIEKGDEYLDGEKWKLVPKDDFGLQIMFSKYTQVRRPSEKPINTNGISPTQQGARNDQAVKAESEKTPVPTHSGTGESPATAAEEAPMIGTATGSSAAYLPTVISRKAHPESGLLEKIKKTLGETPETVRPTEVPQAGSVSPTLAPLNMSIPFPHNGEIWTGRNGTFKARGLNIYRRSDKVIRLIPEGQRGTAKNAVMEFPVSVIPMVIDFLQKQI